MSDTASLLALRAAVAHDKGQSSCGAGFRPTHDRYVRQLWGRAEERKAKRPTWLFREYASYEQATARVGEVSQTCGGTDPTVGVL